MEVGVVFSESFLRGSLRAGKGFSELVTLILDIARKVINLAPNQ